MLLADLLQDIYAGGLSSNFSRMEIQSISPDSREVGPGTLFVACPGTREDGLNYVRDAVARGGRVIAGSRLPPSQALPREVCFLAVADPRDFLKEVLRRFYHDPSGDIKIVGITGTNGKTTVTYLVESMLQAAGRTCGVIGTVAHRFGQTRLKASNTTPGIADNFRLLSEMVRDKIDYCAMEVSSHALVQRRVDGLDFHAAVFTNLTSDHLDYHANQEDYFQAKTGLFTALSPKAKALINIDDPFGTRLLGMTRARVLTYGLNAKADLRAEDIRSSLNGSTFRLLTPVGQQDVKTALIGRHNIYNILAAAGVGVGDGWPLDKIAAGIERLSVVPGRLESVAAGQEFSIFIDYAHTEDALKNVLTCLRQVCPGRIILVFGCGGDRDQSKRPLMGKVADELADYTVVTSDNPRGEDPQAIIQQIVAGFSDGPAEIVVDRKEAIGHALAVARPGDTLLIAGKGHEDYQRFKDKDVPFDERNIIRDYLLSR